MLLILQPIQIPKFWEAIKYAAVATDNVEEQYRPQYLNGLLHDLLSSKAQCFVRISDGEDRQLQSVMITRFVVDVVRNEKSLFIQSLFSFEHASEEQWLREFEHVKEFGRKNDCTCMVTWTNNDKAVRLSNIFGMRPGYRSFILDL